MAYPLPRPDDDEDERYTYGLLLDIARLIEQHGYPPIQGEDMVELSLALFRFLYEPAPESST